jgi:hypothetical protein
VYSRDLKWEAVGDQAEWFQANDLPRPVIDDILIMKLRPGQVTTNYQKIPLQKIFSTKNYFCYQKNTFFHFLRKPSKILP